MRILLLSFYYPPDLSAGSFRAAALVEAFRAHPAAPELDVVTTAPNRYSSLAADAPEVENSRGVSIHRVRLPPHRSRMADQSRAFCVFARAALRVTEANDYDLVLATSSRLMTAFLGAVVATRKRTKLYLDIRDIFADNLNHIAPRGTGWLMQPAFSLIERWVVSRAAKVNLVSPGFASYFSRRYPSQRFSFITNGIDDEFLDAAARDNLAAAPRALAPVTVLYAGNIGEGQGLHCILPELAKRMGDRVRFRVIGDGGRRVALSAALSSHEIGNVELLAPIPRAALMDEYRAADVLFLHLNDYEAFKAVLPSKIFEYAALGKPIWAGVAGYSAEFLEAEVTNAAVFDPCDATAAMDAFGRLILSDSPRPGFLAKYARSTLSAELASDVIDVARA